MATMLQPMIGELQQEGATTRRVLERVPADRLSWRPHPKSMSLGQLALHTAMLPANLAKLAQSEGLDGTQANFDQAEASSNTVHLTTFWVYSVLGL